MLLKKNKATNRDIDLLFKSGSHLGSSNLTLKFTKKQNELAPRVSFVVPKSLFKKASDRNFLKRIGFLAVKDHISILPKGFLGVFIFSKNIKNIDLKDRESVFISVKKSVEQLLGGI